MIKIYCNFITLRVQDFAVQLKMNASTVNNLISTWKTKNPNLGEPTIEQLKEFILLEKKIILDYYLAIPYYEVKKSSEDGRLVSTHKEENGMHTITLYYDIDKKGEYLDNFFDYILGKIDNVTSKLKQKVMEVLASEGITEEAFREVLTNNTEAMLFLLWHEMAHIEWNHAKDYYTDEERLYLKNKEYDKINWLAPNKIKAEVDAARQAYRKAKAYNTRYGKKLNDAKKQNEVFKALTDWIKTASLHITFDKKEHKYYIDGNEVDSSVTLFTEAYYGKPNIEGDYTHSALIGTSVDNLSRDFFSGEHDVYRTTYPNISESRKASIISHLIRLKLHLDGRFGTGKYKILTNEFPIAALYNTPLETKTIAGTMDMCIIDEEGNVHIFDFKVKNHSIDLTYNGRRVNDERDYTAQLNLYKAILESINPNIKVKSVLLIWFDTDYPKINQVLYKVNNDDEVMVTDDGKEIPLRSYPKFTTPSLKPDITKSIIPLLITSSIAGLQIPKMQSLDLKSQVRKTIEFADRAVNVSSDLLTQSLTIVPTNQTAIKAKEIGGIDTLRHPDNNGMHFGNPFSHTNYTGVQKVMPNVKEAVIAFEQWLRGTAYQDIEPQRRQWILDQINNGALDNKPLVYYTDKVPDNSYGRDTYDYYKAPNHAHILQKLINEHKQSNGVQKHVKSMGAEILQKQQSSEAVMQTEAENFKTPTIGVQDNFSVDKESAIAKLAKTFTPIERAMRVEALARLFSSKIDTALQNLIEQKTQELSEVEDLDEIQLIESELSELKDPETGRKAAIKEVSLMSLFDEMKGDFEEISNMSNEDLIEEYGEELGKRMQEASRKIVDNFYPLLNEALNTIEYWEDIRIVTEQHDYNTGKEIKKVIDGSIADTSIEENDDTFEDDTDGKRVTGNDGWSYKVRFIDPHTTLSKKVKRLLSDIALEGPNGIEYDDIGNMRYLNAQTVYMILMDKLSTMKSSDEFAVKDADGKYTFPALKKIAIKYPWVNQIINTLYTDPSLIASFYTAFRKDFIPYWMQYFDTRAQQWKTHQLNAPTAQDSTITDIVRNYELGINLTEDSVYQQQKLSKENASKGLGIIGEVEDILQEYDEQDYPKMSEAIGYTLRMLGVNVTQTDITNILNGEDSDTNIRTLISAIKGILDNVASGKTLETDHLVQTNNENYKRISNIVGAVTDLSNMNSFRQGDKTLYSYSSPNYINTLVKSIKNDDAISYIEENFNYDWFKSNGNWREGWIKELIEDDETRNQVELKELKYLGDKEYSKWTKGDITFHFIAEYYSIPRNRSTAKQYAWYGFPILADSEVALLMKFSKEEGVGYKDRIITKMREVVLQELYRIDLVNKRKKLIEQGQIQEIANFDTNGDKFHFFPELNAYKDDILNTTTEASRNAIIEEALREIMQTNFEDFIINSVSSKREDIAKHLQAEGIINDKSELDTAIEEYFYNSTYAKSQIIQLTTTDLAFYKDDVDFQKRFKEIYAAGDKLFTNSKYGKKERKTIYLEDEILTSSSYESLKDVLDEALKQGRIQSYDRDNILHKFKDIDATDAQALISPNAFRSVLDMMGKWTDEMNEALEHFKEGNWDMKDFNVVWQTIKPFVYTQLPKPDGFGGTIKVPHQNKNSEFLLLAAYSTIASSLNKSPKLRAIADFMDTYGIDVVQFKSAVKAGSQGVISLMEDTDGLLKWLKDNKDVDNKTINTVNDFKEYNDRLLDEGIINQEEYNKRMQAVEPTYEEVIDTLEDAILNDDMTENSEVVHTIPYEDYVVQQPTPEHLFDTEAIFGSQFRNLIISDLPKAFSITIDDIKLDKKQLVYLYQTAITENLLDAYEKLKGKFTDIDTLQKELIRSIKSNSNYSRDLVNALEIVEAIKPLTGETKRVFNIPLNNPSTTEELQKLILSMFKNRVTKQHIKGGNCILVSDFGLTHELHIVYNEEGNKASGIKGIECYMPAYSKEFIAAISTTDKDGNIILDINKLPNNLKKAIGYRI